jgi:hypothetical protein
MNTKILAAVLLLLLLALLAGCKDAGIEPQPDPVTPPPPAGTVSFSHNVLPILTVQGCVSCHGGSGGLIVGTVADLLAGGNHGPAVIPGDAAGSNLVKKLVAPPPFGERMPLGGFQLPDSTINVIRTWINQGAKNN